MYRWDREVMGVAYYAARCRAISPSKLFISSMSSCSSVPRTTMRVRKWRIEMSCARVIGPVRVSLGVSDVRFHKCQTILDSVQRITYRRPTVRLHLLLNKVNSCFQFPGPLVHRIDDGTVDNAKRNDCARNHPQPVDEAHSPPSQYCQCHASNSGDFGLEP